MNECSATVPPEVDEFKLSGLTPIPSDLVKPDRVAESRVHMEYRLVQVVTVSDKPNGGSLVLGEVLRFHLAEDVVNNFYIDPDRLRAIGRMAGMTYCRTTDRFEFEARRLNPNAGTDLSWPAYFARPLAVSAKSVGTWSNQT